MIVVVQTRLECILGEVDADGNVTRKTPVSLEIPALKKELFEAAYEHLVKTRKDAVSQLPSETPVEPEPAPRGEYIPARGR